MGILGWSPDLFWASTLCDFNAAYEGWRSFHDQNYHREHEAKEMRADFEAFKKGQVV